MARQPVSAGPLAPGTTVLVTGAAGFIGFFLAQRLLQLGCRVVGLDNLTDYYDPALKEDRLKILRQHEDFSFKRVDIAAGHGLAKVFTEHRPLFVAHMAAQAGVRYSIDHPHAYASANLTGFLNVLEGCRHYGCRHLVYASSSSVYGGNVKVPFQTSDPVDHPVSLYAATKKSNELMAHAYADLYGLASTGLRFFTVYGPWGRPDMAYFKFTKAIFEDRPIQIYNHGDMARDFTYIDDIVEGVTRVIPHIAAPDPGFDRVHPNPATSWAPHRVYNIGNHRREKLMDMITALERATGREAIKEFLPMQPGDVPETWADVSDLEAAVGFAPDTPLADGLARFVTWYRDYYAV